MKRGRKQKLKVQNLSSGFTHLCTKLSRQIKFSVQKQPQSPKTNPMKQSHTVYIIIESASLSTSFPHLCTKLNKQTNKVLHLKIVLQLKNQPKETIIQFIIESAKPKFKRYSFIKLIIRKQTQSSKTKRRKQSFSVYEEITALRNRISQRKNIITTTTTRRTRMKIEENVELH